MEIGGFSVCSNRTLNLEELIRNRLLRKISAVDGVILNRCAVQTIGRYTCATRKLTPSHAATEQLHRARTAFLTEQKPPTASPLTPLDQLGFPWIPECTHIAHATL